MIHNRLYLLFLSFMLLTSCSLFDFNPKDTNPIDILLGGEGLFVVNEGNFTHGNGSLSFYSFDSLKIYNDLFSSVNGRPLGDVPFSMSVRNGKGYIVVNNSGKIEVVNVNTLTSLATIQGLNSPRNMLFISPSRAFVTSMWGKEVAVVDLLTGKVSGSINIRRSSESIVMAGDKVYISSYISGNEIMVIDTTYDSVIDSITVGREPESMVVDKNSKLWVLCSGGYTGDYTPELIRINTATNQIEKRELFPSVFPNPTTLRINRSGDTLYFLRDGIWRMGISSAALPAAPFVQSSGRMFYNLGLDPVNNFIYVTNAVNYVDRGYLIKIKNDGTIIDSVRTDIIPGSLCFKLNLN